MKRLASGLRATVPLVIATAMLSASHASADTCAAAGKFKPFKASFDFSEVLAGIDPMCPMGPAFIYKGSETAPATGNATHLGRITVSVTNCVYPTPPTLVFVGPAVTITAANGDKLTATYAGTATPALSTPGSGLFDLRGQFQITGGDGRFANARGQGTLSGSQQVGSPEPPYGLPRSGTGSIELDGVIAYGSKDKSKSCDGQDD